MSSNSSPKKRPEPELGFLKSNRTIFVAESSLVPLAKKNKDKPKFMLVATLALGL
jgi:hypothetical protein